MLGGLVWFSQTRTRNPTFYYMQEDNSTSPLTTIM